MLVGLVEPPVDGVLSDRLMGVELVLLVPVMLSGEGSIPGDGLDSRSALASSACNSATQSALSFIHSLSFSRSIDLHA